MSKKTNDKNAAFFAKFEKNQQLLKKKKNNKVVFKEDKNSLFFEKFEKKPKNKQPKESFKVLKQQSAYWLVLNRLLQKRTFLVWFWVIFVTLSVLFFAYSVSVLSFLGDKFWNTSDLKWVYANYYHSLTQTAVVFAGFVVVLIPLPYLFLFTSFFVDINNVSQNKYFILIALGLVFFVLVFSIIIAATSSVVFEQTRFFHPLQ